MQYGSETHNAIGGRVVGAPIVQASVARREVGSVGDRRTKAGRKASGYLSLSKALRNLQVSQPVRASSTMHHSTSSQNTRTSGQAQVPDIIITPPLPRVSSLTSELRNVLATVSAFLTEPLWRAFGGPSIIN